MTRPYVTKVTVKNEQIMLKIGSMSSRLVKLSKYLVMPHRLVAPSPFSMTYSLSLKKIPTARPTCG